MLGFIRRILAPKAYARLKKSKKIRMKSEKNYSEAREKLEELEVLEFSAKHRFASKAEKAKLLELQRMKSGYIAAVREYEKHHPEKKIRHSN